MQYFIEYTNSRWKESQLLIAEMSGQVQIVRFTKTILHVEDKSIYTIRSWKSNTTFLLLIENREHYHLHHKLSVLLLSSSPYIIEPCFWRYMGRSENWQAPIHTWTHIKICALHWTSTHSSTKWNPNETSS